MDRILVGKDKAVDWLEGTRERSLLGNDAKDSGLGHPVAHGAQAVACLTNSST